MQRVLPRCRCAMSLALCLTPSLLRALRSEEEAKVRADVEAKAEHAGAGRDAALAPGAAHNEKVRVGPTAPPLDLVHCIYTGP